MTSLLRSRDVYLDPMILRDMRDINADYSALARMYAISPAGRRFALFPLRTFPVREDTVLFSDKDSSTWRQKYNAVPTAGQKFNIKTVLGARGIVRDAFDATCFVSLVTDNIELDGPDSLKLERFLTKDAKFFWPPTVISTQIQKSTGMLIRINKVPGDAIGPNSFDPKGHKALIDMLVIRNIELVDKTVEGQIDKLGPTDQYASSSVPMEYPPTVDIDTINDLLPVVTGVSPCQWTVKKTAQKAVPASGSMGPPPVPQRMVVPFNPAANAAADRIVNPPKNAAKAMEVDQREPYDLSRVSLGVGFPGACGGPGSSGSEGLPQGIMQIEIKGENSRPGANRSVSYPPQENFASTDIRYRGNGGNETRDRSPLTPISHSDNERRKCSYSDTVRRDSRGNLMTTRGGIPRGPGARDVTLGHIGKWSSGPWSPTRLGAEELKSELSQTWKPQFRHEKSTCSNIKTCPVRHLTRKEYKGNDERAVNMFVHIQTHLPWYVAPRIIPEENQRDSEKIHVKTYIRLGTEDIFFQKDQLAYSVWGRFIIGWMIQLARLQEWDCRPIEIPGLMNTITWWRENAGSVPYDAGSARALAAGFQRDMKDMATHQNQIAPTEPWHMSIYSLAAVFHYAHEGELSHIRWFELISHMKDFNNAGKGTSRQRHSIVPSRSNPSTVTKVLKKKAKSGNDSFAFADFHDSNHESQPTGSQVSVIEIPDEPMEQGEESAPEPAQEPAPEPDSVSDRVSSTPGTPGGQFAALVVEELSEEDEDLDNHEPSVHISP